MCRLHCKILPTNVHKCIQHSRVSRSSVLFSIVTCTNNNIGEQADLALYHAFFHVHVQINENRKTPHSQNNSKIYLEIKSISLTHMYMTVHSPGLAQALQRWRTRTAILRGLMRACKWLSHVKEMTTLTYDLTSSFVVMNAVLIFNFMK